ncbi:MAG: hypothetical protein ACUVXA_03935 [Candidatus Jordarchaeum sp.]|uniref:hypothetical protein n=1 Tax=Candidatus Jordarchaeum sp. TaxID=2823881 RepID=UPI0040495B7A
MDEKSIYKIWDAYNKAAPHLCEFVWLKNEISYLVSNTKSLEMFINALHQKIQKEKITSRKTDLKIYIFYLSK